MKQVADVMTRGVRVCRMDDSMSYAARLMWENDCGALPVVDGAGKVVGMITDRDLCMAAYTQGLSLGQLHVGKAASRKPIVVRDADGIEVAEGLMRAHRVRRLPVVDRADLLVGILTMNDLARHAEGRGRRGPLTPENVVGTLAAIGESSALDTVVAAQ